MFSSSSTYVVEGYDASKQDIELLVKSEKGELFGDPFFGIRTDSFRYNQNSSVMRDILADELFTQLSIFAPQIYLTRNDVEVRSEGSTVYAVVKCTNRSDFKTNMYELVLFKDDER